MCSLYQNEWKEIAPLNRQRQQLGVCELRGRVFAIGGSDGLHRLNSVEIYSPESNAWSETTSLQVTLFPLKFILLFLQQYFDSTLISNKNLRNSSNLKANTRYEKSKPFASSVIPLRTTDCGHANIKRCQRSIYKLFSQTHW